MSEQNPTLQIWREPDFYMEVSCEIEGNKIRVPSITIPSSAPVPWWQRILQSAPGLIKSLSKEWPWF